MTCLFYKGGYKLLSTIYLLQFNNYYNRQVKKYDELGPYLNELFLCKGFLNKNPIPNVNFIPNDGIQTKQVINWDGNNPDYLLVVENNEIISRWFVIESVRNLKGQFELTLYRDTVADYYDQILNATMFIEKGYVPYSDSAFFNDENMTFNQIKTDEFLLKDNTQTAWIVGYCAEADSGVTGESIKYGGIPIPDYEIGVIEDWDYYELYEQEGVVAEDINSLTMNLNLNNGRNNLPYSYIEAKSIDLIKFTSIDNKETDSTVENYGIYLYDSGQELFQTYLNEIYNLTLSSNLKNRILDQFGYTNYSYNELKELNNKILKVGTDKYYRIYVNTSGGDITRTIKSNTVVGTELTETISSAQNIHGTPNDYTFQVSIKSYEVAINLKEITFNQGFTTTLPATRRRLLDAPYCMFCIPYGNFTFTKEDLDYEVEELNSLSLGMGIATALGGLTGSTKFYDLQLLPYCPIEWIRNNGNNLNIDDIPDEIVFKENTDSKTILFFAKESSGSFNITYNYYLDSNAIRGKVNYLTTTWRLCSPNYNGIFEFNAYKNSSIRYINVDYTYKPHQPYIHLNPNFYRLYGKDFDDARGLICGGDFSLPVLDNAWIDYQISNKNFQNIFNRQIENMEINNRIQRRLDEINALTGAVGGVTSGAMAGVIAGGGVYGAVVGGITGGLTSYAAGQADIQMNQSLRNEAIDYTKDQFGYQLQNIQALPDALTRVSSFNKNNKLFPFMEVYNATEEEREALKNKLIYNGMTIMRIGKLKDYVIKKPSTIDYGYFKGQIIRLEDIGDDFHVSNTIASELNKGVYII